MVAIFIGGKKLDLFKDENISITSKLNDLEKLSSVFSDFSQPFTIPATPTNNEVFKHYYNINIDNPYNANNRIDAYVEFDSMPFKYGEVQLESVQVKNGEPDSYKITFYGNLTQLSELFGEDTLDNLDTSINGTPSFHTSLSQFDFQWAETAWKNSLYNDNGGTGDVITPLIAFADRDWNMGTVITGASPSYDITGSTGSVTETELKPGLRIIRLIEGIETKYGIDFSRDFFGRAHFNNIYMWLNRDDEISWKESCFDITVPFTGSGMLGIDDTNGIGFTFSTANPGGYSYMKVVYPDLDDRYFHYSGYMRWFIQPYPGFEDINYAIRTYDENNSQVGYNSNITGDRVHNSYFGSDENPDEDDVTLISRERRICLEPQANFEAKITCTAIITELEFGVQQSDITDVESLNNPIGISQSFAISQNVPSMKVLDFLQGIMKMYKLIISPTSTTSFYIAPINQFYRGGQTWNLTQYIDQNKIDITKPVVYKTIDFNFEKTENVLGKKFRKLFDPTRDKVGYGDLSGEYDIDNKEKLEVKVPFENMMFERMPVISGPNSGVVSNVVIGQSIKANISETEFEKNKSKPILFYNNGVISLTDNPVIVSFGGNTSSLDYSYLVGNSNDELYNQVTQTLNFGSEVDPFLQGELSQSLFSNYWQDWIETIYDEKQRKVKCTGYLPPIIINELSLDDRIIIGSNRYKISDYKVELNTGRTDFNLFVDIFENQIGTGGTTGRNIVSNSGSMYYGIPVGSNISWSGEKIDSGDGITWVDIISGSGSGEGELTMKIDQKTTGATSSRSMNIFVDIDGATQSITVTQKGRDQ
jgi:hypothetical protein